MAMTVLSLQHLVILSTGKMSLLHDENKYMKIAWDATKITSIFGIEPPEQARHH